MQENEKNNFPEPIEVKYEFIIPKGQAPERLDQFLTRSIYNASRTKVQKAIEEKKVLVNGNPKKVSYKIAKNDFILCTVLKPPPIELVPENIPLNIIYEDEYLLIVNKSAGMCVHPGIGNRYGTLINALLYHFGIRENLSYQMEYSDDSYEDFPEENNDFDEDIIPVIASDSVAISGKLKEIATQTKFARNDSFANEIISDSFQHTVNDNRPGLVHRIDKDTTGLLVIAKNVRVHADLAKQFANKTTEREYFAIVWGKPKNDSGRIEGNIGRSSRDRTSFAVLEKDGKPAITDYEVVERFAYTSLLKFKLLTGRTHQIRVHSGSIGHKLFGDVRYGGNIILFGKENPQWRNLAQKQINFVGRQMLHAKTLGFIHPITKEKMLFDSELPADMQTVIDEIRKYSFN